jgi:hypothetical protein
MSLTRNDLKDAALLLKAGKIDIVREILSSSSDPRAMALLAKLDARVALQAAPAPKDELDDIKQLIRQKRFAEAEVMLRASSHPKASHLLEKLVTKTSSNTAGRHPRGSVLSSMFVVLSRVTHKARGVFVRR